MPWVIGIIMFLTVLAAAAGFALARSAKGLDADLAGQAPSTHLIDVVDEDGEPTGATVEVHDPGHGLLAQVGNYELVTEEI